MGFHIRGRRKGLSGKRSRFNPDQNYIEQAVKSFLRTGGKITTIEPTFCEIQGPPNPALADEFLLGK